ncbi:AMP-binding protein [Streptomyces mobaraensis]|uniref:AMP-binding protein n=1 Tax=Streptomyces mobaraensis TaxID=35621 RepID=UPI0033F9240C
MTVRTLDRFPLPPSAVRESAPGDARENARENALENSRERTAPEAAAPPGLRLTAAQRELWSRPGREQGGATPVSSAQVSAASISATSVTAGPISAAYREIRGPLDPVLFAEALHRTVGEADALRMRVVDTPDGPRQRPIAIEPPGHGFPLCAADLRVTEGMGETGGGDGGEDPEAFRTALTWMRADLVRGFDPDGGPLFAYALFRVGDRRWLWYRRVHRALLDAHGHRLVDRRVAEVYTALAAGEDPGPSPFGRLADLVAEDAAYRASPARERDRAYWRSRLAHPTVGDDDASHTSSDHHRHPHPTGNTFHLDAETTAGLCELAASVRGSRTGLLLAAQALHLCRATGRRDVFLGLPLPGRTGPAALRVPGTVRNTVPLRLAVSPDATLAGLVRQADDAVREARAHQRYRRADLRRDLGLPAGHPALAGPLVDVVPAGEPVAFAGAPSTLHALTPETTGEGAAVTFRFPSGETADEGLRVDTWTDHPSEPQEQRHALHALLTRLPALDPHVPLSALSLVPDEEHERALREGNDTAVPVPATTAIGPFEARAARTPEATALVAGDERLTYARLNARANRLARHLTTLGVRPGTFAAVDLPWSTAGVVALLAVLKAGGACLFSGEGEARGKDSHAIGGPRAAGPYGEPPVPVCALTTASTRSACSAPSAEGPRTVLLDDPDLPAVLAAHPPVDPARALTPHDPAYATRTTDTTRHTVVVPHSALDNRLRWLQHHHPLTPADRLLLQGPSSPDTLAVEVLWPLREGATLVLAAPETGETGTSGNEAADGRASGCGADAPAAETGPDDRPDEAGEAGAPVPSPARRVREHGITVARFDTAALRKFLGAPEAGECGRLRHVLTGGEPPDQATADRFTRLLPHTALHHHFGPPEAPSAAHRTWAPEGAAPHGTVRPVWNARLHVLDPALRPCPPGVPGELYIAGTPLAMGYAGHPARTAGRFPADPYGPPGTRMYRTGRGARRRADGGVELLAASDPDGCQGPTGGGEPPGTAPADGAPAG